MDMFARFDENPAITFQDIKETKLYGRTHARTDTRTDNVKTVYPPQTKFAGGLTTLYFKKLFQEYYQSVKQFGSRTGLTFCRA